MNGIPLLLSEDKSLSAAWSGNSKRDNKLWVFTSAIESADLNREVAILCKSVQLLAPILTSTTMP